MPRILNVVLAIVLAILTCETALASTGRTSVGPRVSFMPSSDYCADAEELALMTLINTWRQQNGLGALTFTQTLGAAADHHSQDMTANNILSHTLSDGTSWSQNMTNHGYTYNTWRGEIIAGGYETARNTFEQFRNSPAHNDVMLSSVYTAMGVGRAGSGTAASMRWTVDFGGYADAPVQACGATAPATATPPATATSTAVASPSATPSPTKTATPRPTSTVTPTPPATLTSTATRTATAVPTATRQPTQTPVPTATSIPPTVAPASAAYISQMSGRVKTEKGIRRVTVTINVASTDGRSMGGATVAVAVTAPDGSLRAVSCVTNKGGKATCVAEIPIVPGTVLAQVTGVDAGPIAYDASRNLISSVQVPVK